MCHFSAAGWMKERRETREGKEAPEIIGVSYSVTDREGYCDGRVNIVTVSAGASERASVSAVWQRSPSPPSLTGTRTYLKFNHPLLPPCPVHVTRRRRRTRRARRSTRNRLQRPPRLSRPARRPHQRPRHRSLFPFMRTMSRTNLYTTRLLL